MLEASYLAVNGRQKLHLVLQQLPALPALNQYIYLKLLALPQGHIHIGAYKTFRASVSVWASSSTACQEHAHMGI